MKFLFFAFCESKSEGSLSLGERPVSYRFTVVKFPEWNPIQFRTKSSLDVGLSPIENLHTEE